MQKRQGLRRAARVALATGALVAVALAPVHGVDALENETVKYDPTGWKPFSYHADVVMAPTDGGTVTDVDGCAVVTWCTVVPLEITPLQRGENEDWVVQLDVKWDDSKVQTPDNVAGEQQGNDLDVYMYHWGQLEDEEGNPATNEDGSPEMGYVETGRSASGKDPETFKLYRPTQGKYWLVVINFVGVNRGFDLNFSSEDTSFGGLGSYVNDKPLPPAVSKGDDDRLSFGDKPATPYVAPKPVEAPTAFADSDFGFASEIPEDLLAADEGPTRGSLFADEVKAPPADVGGGTILLWLGLVPLVLLAGVAAFLVKRRPSALSLRVPMRRGAAATEAVADV